MLERLGRIEALERGRVPADVLLGEVRALLREAEAWLEVEPDPEARAAFERCESALVERSAGAMI